MPDKSLSLPLRRLLGLSEESSEFLLEPVTIGPAPIAGAGDFETETLRRIWLFLEQKRGDRTMLSRADIDPADLLQVLPRVGLTELHQSPPRYRMRLAGTHWTNVLGFDPTGMWLDQWPLDPHRQLFEALLDVTVATKRAHYARRQALIEGGMMLFEAMVLPLSPDGETINMLLSMGTPWRSGRTRATLKG